MGYEAAEVGLKVDCTPGQAITGTAKSPVLCLLMFEQMAGLERNRRFVAKGRMHAPLIVRPCH